MGTFLVLRIRDLGEESPVAKVVTVGFVTARDINGKRTARIRIARRRADDRR